LSTYLEDRAADVTIKAATLDWLILFVAVAFSIVTLAGPATRAWYRLEVNYNEGWNAYNAQRVIDHARLYPEKYGWTTVNYPIVSFYFIGYLSRLLGDPILTGRLVSLLSLLVSCVCVALIVKKLTENWSPALFSASFCLALFCTSAPTYVGMDDPQMLGHPFILLGLLLYLGGAAGDAMILAIAALFVLGGNVKQSLLAAPFAVLSDLLMVSRAKALRFVFYGSIVLAASIAINILVGGPFFFSNLLVPRRYMISKAIGSLMIGYGWLQIPLMVSLVWSIWYLRHRQYRVIALYFWTSLLFGIAFGGGLGVYVNMQFDNFFAMAIIMGLVLDSAWRLPIPQLQNGSLWRSIPALVLYVCVFFTFCQSPFMKLPKFISQLPAEQRQFRSEVSALSAQPGPAICESLLHCFYSGKPYVYDPFNSTSLVNFGKLNSGELVQQIAEHRFGAIQTRFPVTQITRPSERFPNEVLDAIDRDYQISWRDPECIIYVPRGDGPSVSPQ
jgi:hypothetical protein